MPLRAAFPSYLWRTVASHASLAGECAGASLRNLPVEVHDFATLLPKGHPLFVGLYFTPYHSCDPPSARYDEHALAAALALPQVSGATVYTFESPSDISSCTAGSTDKGCIVRDVFG